MAVTRSTQQAMGLLNTTRRFYIDYAKALAVELARTHPVHEVDSYTLVKEMERRGVINPTEAMRRHWAGAVFNQNRLFRDTRIRASYTRPDRNVHEREVTLWRLRNPNTPPIAYPKPSDYNLTRTPGSTEYQWAAVPPTQLTLFSRV